MLYPSFGLAAQNLYLFWQGQEFLPDLDPYYGREFSGLLAALMWKGWIGFPFGLVAPLALVGLGFRLRSPERSRAETSILLFVVTCSVETLFFECTLRHQNGASAGVPSLCGPLSVWGNGNGPVGRSGERAQLLWYS